MEDLNMSRKEREQIKVLDNLKKGLIKQKEAALQLGITTRWVRKKFRRYVEKGDAGVIHRSKGKMSKRKWNDPEKTMAIELLASEWKGFGPTFASEKLEELKNIKVSKETLRKAMIEAKIWQGKERRVKHRKRRERRPMVGMMVQLDGSPHDWFEGRGPWCTLLVFIDDATSRILWLEFVTSENHLDVLRATKNYVTKFGRPHEFYVDFGSVFSVNTNNPERDKKTQWERAMKELLIEVIHAHSPQAKGRVERANKTLQDRLVHEMRIAGITSMEEGNRFLQSSGFIAKHNVLFPKPPAQLGDAHRPIDGYQLDNIFCLKEERVLANDFTITYNKRIFQLEARQRTIIRPKNRITVNTHLDGSIRLSIRATDLAFREIGSRPSKQLQEEKTRIDRLYKPTQNSRRWVAGLLPAPTNPRERVG
jgi:hypothetical protein